MIRDIDIIYRDQHMIALDKPCGLLSVPGIGPEKQDCLAARVQEAFPTARIVHRLDRDTSGVIVMALDETTHRELSRQFHDRETIKRYIAVVAGRMDSEEGVIDLPIRKDLDNPPRQIVDHEHGRPSVTRWHVIRGPVSGADQPPPQSFLPEGAGFSTTRLELQPITGRSHQLRVHLEAIGHPILGDDLYAPPEVLAASGRLLLHAAYLLVTDPYTAAPREFSSACPF